MHTRMDIRAVAFDTGGTVLDWHGGLVRALARLGEEQSVRADWHALANDWRRRALKGIVGQVRPAFNMEDMHRRALDEVLEAAGMSPPPGRPKEGSLPLGGTARSAQGAPMKAATVGQRQQVWRAWQELDAWPGFASALERLRRALPVVSFTMLPTAMVMNVSRRNDLVWDAVISCEMIGVYKAQPEAYATAARWLALDPSQILMVACHNFDLNGAHAAGFRTAFVRRPDEWGPEGPPDPNPNMRYDFVEDDFDGLVRSVMSRSMETAPAPRDSSSSSGAAQVR